MKKIVVALSCALIALSACGKKDNSAKNEEPKSVTEQMQQVIDSGNLTEEELGKVSDAQAQQYLADFNDYAEPQKYYFCAAFAMGAMSVAKPITASAMVNYFMGLGVAKYEVGINDETYEAFNAGKNTFLNETVVNTILKEKICEDIMNDAADFAKDNNYNVADLDKMGKTEVEKVVRYIKKQDKK